MGIVGNWLLRPSCVPRPRAVPTSSTAVPTMRCCRGWQYVYYKYSTRLYTTGSVQARHRGCCPCLHGYVHLPSMWTATKIAVHGVTRFMRADLLPRMGVMGAYLRALSTGCMHAYAGHIVHLDDGCERTLNPHTRDAAYLCCRSSSATGSSRGWSCGTEGCRYSTSSSFAGCTTPAFRDSAAQRSRDGAQCVCRWRQAPCCQLEASNTSVCERQATLRMDGQLLAQCYRLPEMPLACRCMPIVLLMVMV